jgi:hypothetical protein
MLYPGPGRQERGKAAAFAAHWLARPIRKALRSGVEVTRETLLTVAMAGGTELTDLEERWWRGTATGEVFKTLFALANTNYSVASWSNAIKICEHVAVAARERAGHAFLWDAKRSFVTVAHLWTAWNLRQGKFKARPSAGYDLADDFQSFLTEAEILRQWGQSWLPARSKGEHPLPRDVWHPHSSWHPPQRQAGWPNTGRIPALTLPDDLIGGLRPAGRPARKI